MSRGKSTGNSFESLLKDSFIEYIKYPDFLVFVFFVCHFTYILSDRLNNYPLIEFLLYF